jgi:DNA-binding transcriptional LysR family regulator
LGVGRRFIAPHVPAFKDLYPQIDVRLRLSDRVIDVTAEGLDVAFHLGVLEDSTLKVRLIADCPRVLCAAPAYIARRGMPADGAALVGDKHDCLNLRFPGAKEFQWTLQTTDGPRRFEIGGPFESDDGDVLTGWALDGRGIVMKPIFEVAQHLRSGALVPVAVATPPMGTQLSSLSQHRRLKDPKVKLFTEFMAGHIRDAIRRAGEELAG